MFVRYRTLAFVLKKQDRGEADQIFTVFTKDYGKLSILGKAIRKTKSKLRSGMEPFYLSEIEFIQGKAFKTLTDVICKEKFKEVRKDFEKVKISHQILEVIDSLIKGEESDLDIWSLILKTFEKLNSSAKTSLLFYHYFLWNFFSALGYLPVIDKCVHCQKKLIPSNLYFDFEQGGILCNNCSKKANVSPEVIKIIRLLLKEDWQVLSRLKIKEKEEKDLEKISEEYLNHLYTALDIS